MSNKKLEVVELNKKEEKIILEQKDSLWVIFWRKYSKLILLLLLILSIAILATAIIVTISNLSTSSQPIIKEVSIDTSIGSLDVTIDPSFSLTDETAQNAFKNNSIFKSSGEVLLVKTITTDTSTIKFYSDYTAIKINKNNDLVTRINSIDGNKYGIDESGVINSKAEISDVSLVETKQYSWGTVKYYSDGSAEVTNSKMDMYVRNSKDINENYISNNKVSYAGIGQSIKIGEIKINYYFDGTIEVIKNNISYVLRDQKDYIIKSQDVIFNNNNQATIIKTINLDDGKKIDYYTDGGAIISDGDNKLSVRKSNSIIIKDNKIYEIVDNKYVTISKNIDNGNIIYYTDGSAVIKNYSGKTIYVKENSNIKYKNDKINNINEDYEKLTDSKNINGDKILQFESVAVVESDELIAIVPKDNVIYDTDGSLKEILDNDLSANDNKIKITNSTNETIKYRLVIEKSDRTNLDIQYIKYQLSIGNTYIEPRRLDSEIWETDNVSNSLSVTGVNYILVDKTLEPHATDDIKLMLWTDYERIPNSMQNKYFYGTIRIYAWKEIQSNI